MAPQRPHRDPAERAVRVRRPYLDEWVYKVHPDTTTLAAALKTGEIDAARVEPKDVEGLKALDTLSFFSYLTPGYTYIGWNQLRGGKEFLQSTRDPPGAGLRPGHPDR